MKPIKTIRSFVLLAVLAAGAVGCQKEELSATGGDTPQGTPLTISVTDGGYTAGNAKSSSATRAVDDGYATTFTAGDQIGLYVVVGDAVVSSNIPLTHNGTGWTGEAYYEGAKAKYFAYYPYQSTLTGTPDASATDASDFFAPLISAWTPASDQGTHAAYTASDLMTGSGTASKQSGGTYSLELTMTHAMALVVIETPMTKYTLTTDANYTWTAEAPDTRFYGFTPYNPSPGTYRYLVKPGQSGAADLMGSYTATGSDGSSTATKEYAVSPNGITTANYALYKVDGGITSKTHTLQVGDFYMNDGSLVSKDTELSEAQKQACIGVVYCVDNSFITEKSTNKSEGGFIHGLVVALRNARTYSTWYNAGSAASDYGNTVAAPSVSSGWYLPNLDELKYICWGNNSSQSTNGKVNLNTLFGKLSDGSANVFGNDFYWSGTEDVISFAYYVNFSNGNASSNIKDANCIVRSSLAF